MQDVFMSLRLYRIAFYTKFRRVKTKVNLFCTKPICFQNICKTEFIYNTFQNSPSAYIKLPMCKTGSFKSSFCKALIRIFKPGGSPFTRKLQLAKLRDEKIE